MSERRHRITRLGRGIVVGFAALVWVGVLATLSGCQQLGCRGQQDTETDETETEDRPWLAQTTALQAVSSDASVVLGVRRVEYLTRVGRYLRRKDSQDNARRAASDETSGGSDSDPGIDAGKTGNSPTSRSGSRWIDRLRRLIAVTESVIPDEGTDDAGRAVGVRPGEPAVVFRESRRWVFGVEIAQHKELFDRLANSASGEHRDTGEVEWFGPDDETRTGLLPVGAGGSRRVSPGFALCVMGNRLFVGELKGREGYSDRVDAICSELGSRTPSGPVPSWTDEWTRGAQEASLVTSLIGGSEVAAGLMRPGVLVRQRKGATPSGHSVTLIDRLAGQLGALGWTMHADPEKGALSATMRLQQSPGQPMAVVDLGSATGSLPEMGGFIDERALGAIRLSADPELTYQLARSLLPPETRRDLDSYWDKFREELKVEIPGSLLNAMSGHMVIGIFGIVPRSRVEAEQDTESKRQKQKPSFWQYLLKGQATREGVMIPITNRGAVERILNVATQLSRGRLSRDKGEHSVHYAWVGERGLSWAVVLTDEFLVFADSGLAFNRAVNFARDEVPVSEALRRQGVHRLFEGRSRSGFFVQAEMISERLQQKGWSEVSDLMKPFEWLLFTSETAGGEGIGRLDFGYRKAADAGERSPQQRDSDVVHKERDAD